MIKQMLKGKFLGVLKSIIYTLIYIFVIFVLQLFFYSLISKINIKYYEYSNALSFLLILPWAFLLYRSRYREEPTLKIKYFVYTGALAVVYYIILFFFRGNSEPTFEYVIYKEVYYIITFLLLSPLLEEIFFRGIILKILTKELSIKLSIIITSILFMLIHIFSIGGLNLSIVYLLQFFIFSVIVSIIYTATKNICCAILFHFIYNLCWYLFRFW